MKILPFFLVLLLSIPLVADNYPNEELFRAKNDKFEEISTLNLINGLNLTMEQMQGLVAVAREAKAANEDFRNRNAGLARETLESYGRLVGELLEKGQEVPKEIQEQARENEKKLKEESERLTQRLKELEDKVDKILYAGQKNIIDGFAPCLIPPKSLRNPTRVGQAYDSGAVEKTLQNIRKSKKEKRADITEKAIEKTLAHEEEKYLGKLEPQEREKEKERIKVVIQKALDMSDSEFEIKKEDLAKETDLKYEQTQAKLTLERLGRGKPGLEKAGKYFLNPRVIPIFEKKIELFRNFKTPPAPDLNGLEGVK